MKNTIPVSDRDDTHHALGVLSSNNTDNNLKGINNNPSSIRRVVKATILFAAIALGTFVLLSSWSSLSVLPASYFYSFNSQVRNNGPPLKKILRNASMEDKTVIITTLNDAWAEPNSIFDLFLESFRIGNNTEGLLKHLVVICMDDKAYALCSASHPHCFQLRTTGANFTNEAFFMTSDYLEMMWRRIKFLGSILQLGYNFVFTDTDIMWLRNPFHRFFTEADFQIACDYFNGNSYDLHNSPNGGFTYVRSNKRTIKFYKYWYKARKFHPGNHDQDVLNKIKFDPYIKKIGIKFRFLDTAYFGGFCQPSINPKLVCTMHANCCVGLDNKVNDLAILLEDWKKFVSSEPSSTPSYPWTVPKNCSTSFQRMHERKSGHH